MFVCCGGEVFSNKTKRLQQLKDIILYSTPVAILLKQQDLIKVGIVEWRSDSLVFVQGGTEQR